MSATIGVAIPEIDLHGLLSSLKFFFAKKDRTPVWLKIINTRAKIGKSRPCNEDPVREKDWC